MQFCHTRIDEEHDGLVDWCLGSSLQKWIGLHNAARAGLEILLGVGSLQHDNNITVIYERKVTPGLKLRVCD